MNVFAFQVKNFPTKITSKWILKKHLTRLIWVLSVQHTAINYPVDHIAALTPNTPTKLYNDDRVGVDHYRIYNLPRRFTCGVGSCLWARERVQLWKLKQMLLPEFRWPRHSMFLTSKREGSRNEISEALRSDTRGNLVFLLRSIGL